MSEQAAARDRLAHAAEAGRGVAFDRAETKALWDELREWEETAEEVAGELRRSNAERERLTR